MSNVIVTKALATVGLTVMRGRDWSRYYGNQDVFAGNKGTIICIGGKDNVPEGWVKVRWEGGGTYNYQVEGGFSDKKQYDLYVYRKQEEAAKPTACADPHQGGYEGRFYIGQLVYVKSEDDMWIRSNDMKRDVAYKIKELNNSGSKESVRVAGRPYWIQDYTLMTEEEWALECIKRVAKPNRPSIEDTRSGLEELSKTKSLYPQIYEEEAKVHYKPNINTENGTTTNPRDYSGSVLYLPPKDLTLKRGERPEGRRLKS